MEKVINEMEITLIEVMKKAREACEYDINATSNLIQSANGLMELYLKSRGAY